MPSPGRSRRDSVYTPRVQERGCGCLARNSDGFNKQLSVHVPSLRRSRRNGPPEAGESGITRPSPLVTRSPSRVALKSTCRGASRRSTGPLRGPIDTYDPPKKGSLGNPVSTAPLVGAGFAGALAFVGFGTRRLGRHLRSIEQPNSQCICVSGWGWGEKSIIGNPSQYPAGVAVTPPVAP
jgi:hypothetical protein